jgi:hypothetical protein
MEHGGWRWSSERWCGSLVRLSPDADKLEEHLKRAAALEPNDAGIKAHFSVLKAMQAKDNAKTAGLYKNMFAALKSDATSNADPAASAAAASSTSVTGPADVDLDEENVTI